MDMLHCSGNLHDAQVALMLPHPEGEAKSIADAFWRCSEAFRDLNDDELDDSAKAYVATIRELMGPGDTPLVDRASAMSVDEQYELRDAVDGLAHWADLKFREID